MKTDATLRVCGTEDISAIAEIERECFEDNWTETMLLSEFSRSGFYGLVLEIQNEIVGYAFATALFENADLERIAVKSARRGLGLGGMLLDGLQQGVKALGAEQLFLEVRPSNTPAVQLYESRGFFVLRTRPRYYADGEDAVEMKKTL